MQQIKQQNYNKFFYDYLPLIVFFSIYKIGIGKDHLLSASLFMIVVSMIIIVFGYYKTKAIPKVPLFTTVIFAFFCGLSIYSDNQDFLKIKLTIINIVFAIILLYAFFSKKPLLFYLFNGQLNLPADIWHKLSLRFACFFLFLAIINELVWRNFNTDFWVNFKIFGATGLSFVFILSQMPIIIKNNKSS
jgi:intracellular septation protein